MTNNKISLENKILLFRQELNDMLEIKPVSSIEILKMSEKLDALIADFYRLKKAI